MFMFKFKVQIFFILLTSCWSVKAQTVDVRIDSLQFFIGQQANITLGVTYDGNQKMQLPNIKAGDELIPNVEVVQVHKPDTSFLNNGKKIEVQQQYTITAWDSSFYYIPPFEVKIDGKPYQSKSLAIKVYTVDVDTLHLDQFFPPHEIMDLPFSWKDWKGVVGMSFLYIFLLMIGIAIYYRVINEKPLVKFIRRKKILPPHKVAINEIERIKAERKWTMEDSKEYYTQLTDTLRTYIRSRYGFNAMEMTSSEIIDKLIEEKNEAALAELREIFAVADLVKFAKYSTLINENDSNLVAAIEYINQTKNEADQEVSTEPVVIKETDAKKMTQRRIMMISLFVIGILLILLSVAVVWRISDLLM